jgi:hypothetical protein
MGAIYWVTPPGEPQPRRVEVLTDFLLEKLAQNAPVGKRAIPRAS